MGKVSQYRKVNPVAKPLLCALQSWCCFLTGRFHNLLCLQPSNLCDTFCQPESCSSACARWCRAAGSSTPGMLWRQLTSIPPTSEHVWPFWGVAGKWVRLCCHVAGSVVLSISLTVGLCLWRGIRFLLIHCVSFFPSHLQFFASVGQWLTQSQLIFSTCSAPFGHRAGEEISVSYSYVRSLNSSSVAKLQWLYRNWAWLRFWQWCSKRLA